MERREPSISSFTVMRFLPGNKLALCLLIISIGALIYGNHLNHPFQFDSIGAIEGNQKLKNPSQLLNLEFFKKEYFHRGLLRMTLGLNAYADGVRPIGYRLVNLVLHLINAILIFGITSNALRYFSRPPGVPEERETRWPALFVALVFLCHPIQTESVVQVINRSELLSATFYLTAFLIFQIFICPRDKSRSAAAKWIAATTIALLFVLGFSAKQTMITLPAVLLLYILCGADSESRVLRFFNRWKWSIAGVVGLGLVLLMWKLLTDESFLTGPSTAGQWIGRKSYMLTQPWVLVFYYLKLILFPFNLNIDPDIEMVTTWASWRFWLPALIMVFLLVQTFKAKSSRLYFFFACWFFIVASPSSSIVTLYDLASEHRVYLASYGAMGLLSFGLHGLMVSARLQPLAARSIWKSVLLAVVVIALSLMTIERNAVWRSPFHLWQDAMSKSPKAYRPHNNLGKAYYEMKQWDLAIRHFQNSIAADHRHPEPHFNLGSVFLDLGRLDEAEREYRLALRFNPGYFQAHLSLGSTLTRKGQHEQAIESFRRAIVEERRATGDRDYPIARLNLGEVYGKTGRYREATAELTLAVRHDPSLIAAHYNLGTAHLLAGKLQEAEQAFSDCLKLNAGYEPALFNLARVYQKQKQWDKSSRQFEKFIRQKGPHAGAYYEIGLNHHQAGNLEAAQRFYQKTLELKPRHLHANFNLGTVYAGDGKSDSARRHLQTALKSDPPPDMAQEILKFIGELEAP